MAAICAFTMGIGIAAVLFCLALARTAASREEPSYVPAVAVVACLFLCILVALVALAGLAV